MMRMAEAGVGALDRLRPCVEALKAMLPGEPH
jgi:hypothetical protein